MSLINRITRRINTAASSIEQRAARIRTDADKRRRGLDPEAPVYHVASSEATAQHRARSTGLGGIRKKFVVITEEVGTYVVAPVRKGLTTAARETAAGLSEAAAGARQVVEHERRLRRKDQEDET